MQIDYSFASDCFAVDHQEYNPMKSVEISGIYVSSCSRVEITSHTVYILGDSSSSERTKKHSRLSKVVAGETIDMAKAVIEMFVLCKSDNNGRLSCDIRNNPPCDISYIMNRYVNEMKPKRKGV